MKNEIDPQESHKVLERIEANHNLLRDYQKQLLAISNDKRPLIDKMADWISGVTKKNVQFIVGTCIALGEEIQKDKIFLGMDATLTGELLEEMKSKYKEIFIDGENSQKAN